MQGNWNALVAKFSRVTDRLGRGIDPGIFETVVVFNGLGLRTVSSCEGHLDDDRGLLFPCIDIDAPEVDSVLQEMKRLEGEVAPVEQKIKEMKSKNADRCTIEAEFVTIDPIYHTMRELREQARRLQARQREKLIHYLTLFYEGRSVPMDRRLILTVKTMLGRTRLGSQAMEDFYVTAPYEIQKQKLKEAQQEMQAFTQFLKQIYFSQQSEGGML
ncbi:hypothetical protein EI42_06402 [Thermosporothrix hazakensis]|jgi:hypothetical protein|uniref:Uncharacterized protein n=1 Tax=Thermosporothrix hazakensis TaxID=644383 RepID=A0A326U3E8_THEHA|nr:hypothetical protein [Thermosporothrix hazakensis]PZW18032.1 hypothetical protein EI42_06402 [Thermosporothrix hazakensis]GCE50644.1 hypothetical protein KTH_55130 [Thermosporothrix hazakensis]